MSDEASEHATGYAVASDTANHLVTVTFWGEPPTTLPGGPRSEMMLVLTPQEARRFAGEVVAHAERAEA